MSRAFGGDIPHSEYEKLLQNAGGMPVTGRVVDGS